MWDGYLFFYGTTIISYFTTTVWSLSLYIMMIMQIITEQNIFDVFLLPDYDIKQNKSFQ